MLNEFANYNERFRAEAVSPIQNKVGQFLTSSVIRNIVAQPKSTIDMADVMDNSKILLINVSKGRIGEDNSNLLGAMLITRIQLAAMDRAKIPEDERKDFYLYVDEFQNFATESFASILSEARKYHLNLTIAHQYIEQMEDEIVRGAVFGNAGTIVCFRVGAADAEYLEKEFAPVFMETDLVNLDKYNAYIKLMINGVTSKAFSMQTIDPERQRYGKRDIVIQVSRERYGRPRQVIEEKISRWSGVVFNTDTQSAPRQQQRSRRQPQKRSIQSDLPSPEQADRTFKDITPTKGDTAEITDLTSLLKDQDETYSCQQCGVKTALPFTPKPGQPVFCKECFTKNKQLQKKQNLKLGQLKQSESSEESKPTFSGPPPPLPM